MQYRSVGHWQRIRLWQAAWLGWKPRLGMGPSRLHYWIIDRRSLWCKGEQPQRQLNKDEMETLSEADFSTLKEF